ncbi:MerR family transcriptional regulator [Sphaerimonospora sp. CA-214678]|uniref:helix-turn-helix domain-containing protein n=1 Tax=Sphaerimonospora sp. CA-214678 TaxID=3240029 RepID=UPI003D92DD40
MDETWTIGELAGRAAALLAPPRPGIDGTAGGDGRVREVPNERLIRWYTTIGLLDPPLARRGRVALYGRRHLLQLVAVKRRQADGLSIAAIQAELAGATDAMLQRIAALPADPPPVTAAPGTIGTAAPATADAMHGTTATVSGPATAEPATAEPGTADAMPATASRGRFWARDTAPAAGNAPVAPDPPVGLVSGVRLAPGVTVLLEGRTPTPEELAAIGRAAGPLLATLTELGLGGV